MALHIITFLAAVALTFWFGRDSSWPSFACAVAAVITHLTTVDASRDRKDDRKEADKKMYAALIAQMPFNPQMIYLRDRDMRAPIDSAHLQSLDNFLHNWDNEAHRFHDKRLEELRATLIATGHGFLTYLSLNTFPLGPVGITKIPDEWRYKDRERYEEVADRLNGDAALIVKTYEDLVRRARDHLKV